MIYLQLGTNIGDRKLNLINCKKLIKKKIGKIVQESIIYESECWGVDNQNNYLNIVINIFSEIGPFILLEKINEIEKLMGRVRNIKWEPRIIDIDILFYKNEIIQSKKLIVPHKFLEKRLFVLKPMFDLNPSLRHPKSKKTIKELLIECEDKSKVFSYEI